MFIYIHIRSVMPKSSLNDIPISILLLSNKIYWECLVRSLFFCVMLGRSLCVLLSFFLLLAIVRFVCPSNYHSDIFKLSYNSSWVRCNLFFNKRKKKSRMMFKHLILIRISNKNTANELKPKKIRNQFNCY